MLSFSSYPPSVEDSYLELKHGEPFNITLKGSLY